MSATFTFKAPDDLTSREVYHQLYHSIRRVVGRSPELTLLWSTEDSLSRSFALDNGDESSLRTAVADIDLRGCAVVTPAEEVPAPASGAPAAEEEVAAEEAAPAPAPRRGRRSKQ